MAVKEASPDAKSLDEAFAGAMGTPPRAKEPPAPPPVDPDAPFGREEDGTPKAPHGYTREGKVRRSTAGRKSKDDTARTQPAAPSDQGAKQEPGAAGRDYSAALAEFGESVWFAGSALGKGGSAIPLVGRYIPERKVAAQAAVFRQYTPNLVKAVNTAAQHNARAARFAAAIETGDITWVAMCAFMVMPFMTVSAAIWKGDDALAATGLPSVAQLAQINDQRLETYLEDVGRQLTALAEQQAAEAAAALAGQDAGAAAPLNGHVPQEAAV